MKGNVKLILGVCLAVGLAMAFTGCASSQVRLKTSNQDPSTPWQEQALLMPLPFRDGKIGFTRVVMVDNAKAAIDSGEIGVIPAGTHTLHIHMEKYVNPIFSNNKYETTTPAQITYDFQPGGRYVLITDLKKKGLLGLAADPIAEIMTLDEYYASKNVGTKDKKMKAELPNIFAQAETQLNSK